MITEWDGKVTEWHSSAVLSHFSYLSVTFQMTEWHSFILWKKYKCVTQNKQIKLQIYEQGGVYAIFKIYPNWFYFQYTCKYTYKIFFINSQFQVYEGTCITSLDI